jgi:hypothetical protein
MIFNTHSQPCRIYLRVLFSVGVSVSERARVLMCVVACLCECDECKNVCANGY